MILGTLTFSFFRSFLSIFKHIAYHPWYIFKISFLWFFLAVTVSYVYFLWTHQGYLVDIRKRLILILFESLLMGLIVSLLLIGMYEFILQMICESKFFLVSGNQVCAISLLENDSRLFFAVAFCQIVATSFWACFYVEPFLRQWYADRIVHGYHWLIIGVTMICLSFWWLTAF